MNIGNATDRAMHASSHGAVVELTASLNGDGANSSSGSIGRSHRSSSDNTVNVTKEDKKIYKEELYKCLKIYPGFGLCTVMWYERSTNFRIMSLVAALLLTAQLVIPILIAIEQLNSGKVQGLTCCYQGNVEEKMMMFMIGAVYVARATLLRTQQRVIISSLACSRLQGSNQLDDWVISRFIINAFPEAAASDYGGEVGDRWMWAVIAKSKFNYTTALFDDCKCYYGDREQSSCLILTVLVTLIAVTLAVMSTTYEQGIYLLNLWIVYTTQGLLNMVLNALVLEFIMKLDDDFMVYYWRSCGRAAKHMYKDMEGDIQLAVMRRRAAEAPSAYIVQQKREEQAEQERLSAEAVTEAAAQLEAIQQHGLALAGDADAEAQASRIENLGLAIVKVAAATAKNVKARQATKAAEKARNCADEALMTIRNQMEHAVQWRDTTTGKVVRMLSSIWRRCEMVLEYGAALGCMAFMIGGTVCRCEL
jgi:uncharacterized membrane protein (Fun14 family)